MRFLEGYLGRDPRTYLGMSTLDLVRMMAHVEVYDEGGLVSRRPIQLHPVDATVV